MIQDCPLPTPRVFFSIRALVSWYRSRIGVILANRNIKLALSLLGGSYVSHVQPAKRQAAAVAGVRALRLFKKVREQRQVHRIIHQAVHHQPGHPFSKTQSVCLSVRPIRQAGTPPTTTDFFLSTLPP